jgi:DNA-binding LacI/PurR family transcriptional regulator
VARVRNDTLSAFPQVSQKRIAEEAGVSQATVSLVLAGRGVSSEQTARRVMEAAERLKYRPSETRSKEEFTE